MVKLGMFRCFHIAISLVAVVLLTMPFDCFAWGTPSREAADCCLKGQCLPVAHSDECCKNASPEANQLASAKAVDHSSSSIALVLVHIPSLAPVLPLHVLGDALKHPPPRIGFIPPTLPLLI